MVTEFEVASKSRTEFRDITAKVQEAVRSSGVRSGVCRIFVPHTTAGVTINENADPSVRRDIAHGLEKIAPFDGEYEHAEGNAAAHIKSSIIGVDRTVLVEGGKLLLGTWQGVFFCEFDGPRQRRVVVKVTEG